MELIKRGRAICSYTPGQTAGGYQRHVGGGNIEKWGVGDPGINAVESPVATTSYDGYESVGTCMI